MTGLIIFIELAVGIGISCAMGYATKTMNENKGYSGGFAWGFWLGLIGIVVVACKPDISRMQYQPNQQNSDYWNRLSGPSQAALPQEWRCTCGNSNSYSISYCTRCHRTRGENSTSINKKPCPSCGARNNMGNTTCFACGKPMDPGALASAVQEITRTAETVADALESTIAPKPIQPAAPVDPEATAAPRAISLKKGGDELPQVPVIDVNGQKEAREIVMIRQLAQLHSEGILTDEEFSAKKAMLLERI